MSLLFSVKLVDWSHDPMAIANNLRLFLTTIIDQSYRVYYLS